MKNVFYRLSKAYEDAWFDNAYQVEGHDLVIIIDGVKKLINTCAQVMLSENLLVLLREYYKIYKPKNYLFERTGYNQYSKRSINNFIAGAKQKAGIKKEGSIHASAIVLLRICLRAAPI